MTEFNRGITSFGVNVVIDHLQCFSSANGPAIPLVSIGSGVGALESMTPNLPWILVDPDPTSFACADPILPQRPPDYPLVRDLLSQRSDLVGNCCVVLNWCEPNNSTYDYDAIVDLRPRAVWALHELFYGSNGAAGGERFHEWRSASLLGKPTTLEDYVMITESSLLPHPQSESTMDIRIAWLQRVDTVSALHNPPIWKKMSYPCQTIHTQQLAKCVIS
jgi:hypothetical protein